MLGGISHDVRTFLTRLRLRVDRIPDEESGSARLPISRTCFACLDDALLASRAGAGELPRSWFDFAQVCVQQVDDRRSAGKPADLRSQVPQRTAPQQYWATAWPPSRDRQPSRQRAGLWQGRHLSIDADSEFVTLNVDDEGPASPRTSAKPSWSPSCASKTPEPSHRRCRPRPRSGAQPRRGTQRYDRNHRRSRLNRRFCPGGARLTVKLPLFVAR